VGAARAVLHCQPEWDRQGGVKAPVALVTLSLRRERGAVRWGALWGQWGDGGSRNGVGKEGVKELGPSLRVLSKLHTLGLG
jgi:hypothetical protein